MGNPDYNGFIKIIAKESNYETECMLYSNLLFVRSSSYKNNELTNIELNLKRYQLYNNFIFVN